MEKKILSLLHLQLNKKAKIIEINGGSGFQRKLRVMGIREGQTIKTVSKQPFSGPLTILVGSFQMTLGRGMAQKIIVEEL
jgi:ferrous iron transport protein A